MSRTRSFVKTAVALSLVAALFLPVSAVASNGGNGNNGNRRLSNNSSVASGKSAGRGANGQARAKGNGNGSGNGVSASAGGNSAAARARAQAARAERLKARIAFVVGVRNDHFTSVAARLTTGAQGLSAMADQVETAGGDVSGVRAAIAKATDLIVEAQQQEADAVSQFQGVPDATNKRLAFAQARAQARTAAATLALARLTLRNAVLDLRAIVNGLGAAAQ